MLNHAGFCSKTKSSSEKAQEDEDASVSCVRALENPTGPFQWYEFLAGGAAAPGPSTGVHADQLIPAPPASDVEQVLQGARRCGRRFMRVFSDNLHNYYVDLLDSKHMMEFRARAFKRRLCRGSKKQSSDNELYRSNSFKFERFERKDDPNDKQVALTDEYSLPVDFVNKRRPISACLEALQAHVELVDTYCDPRDSKAYLVPGEEACGKVYASPDREYTHPYADGTRAGARQSKAVKAAKLAARAAAQQHQQQPSAPPVEDDGAYEDVTVQDLQPRCPYYYADLLQPRRTADTRRYRKSVSVDSAPSPPDCRPRTAPVRGWSEDGGMSPGALAAEPPPDYDSDDMSRRRHLYETAFDSRVAPRDHRDEDISNHAILAVSPAPSSQSNTPGHSREAGASSDNLSTAASTEASTALCGALSGLHLESGSRTSASPLRGFSPPPPSSAPSSAPLPTKFHGPRSLMLSIRSAPHLASKPHQSSAVREIKGRPSSLLYEESQTSKDSSEDGGLHRPRVKAIQEFKGRPGKAERPLSLTAPRRSKFSSTESMATSSSGGSLESVRSSTSEGERSSSSDGRPGSSSLSSHSEDSAGPAVLHGQSQPARIYGHTNSKLHILSPISDKSSLEPCSETSDNNRNNNSERTSPDEVAPGSGSTAVVSSTEGTTGTPGTPGTPTAPPQMPLPLSNSNNADANASKNRRRTPNNRNNMIALSFHDNKTAEVEVPGSDSGISVDGSGLRRVAGSQEVEHLPFDMPKLRRRRVNLILDTTTSGSATSVEAGSAGAEDLPFDMPKLRRKLRAASSESSSDPSQSQLSTAPAPPNLLQDLPFDMPKLRRKLRGSSESSSTSQSDPSVSSAPGGRPALSLELTSGFTTFGGCSSLGAGANFGPSDAFGTGFGSAFASTRGSRMRPGLSLSFGACTNAPSAHIDTSLPLERQGWYLGAISRLEAERLLRQAGEGSYLVRNSESTRQDFSLSLKSARGFMHMRIQKDENGRFILGQFSRPFESVPEMIRHFSVNRLPIRGAEHMCLLHPVIQPLL